MRSSLRPSTSTRPSVRLLVVVAVTAGIIGSVFAVGATVLEPNDTERPVEMEADHVFIQVRLHENGSATWELEYTYDLETPNETEAFERLQTDVEQNRASYRRSFRERVAGSVRRAENETGRDMALSRATVDTHRQQIGGDTGIVTYGVRWSNFSRVDETSLVVGDAIHGFFFDETRTLEFKWPAEYRVETVDPAPTNRDNTSVSWTGPVNFGSTEPTLVISKRTSTPATSVGPESEAPSDTAITGTESTASGASTENAEPPPLVPIALGGAVVLMLGTLGWAYTRVSTTSEAADDGSAVPEELLSNEERVLRALESNGGRMKQQRLREQLDWPGPKTSKVLSRMGDDGDVEVFRIGRENVLTLPDVGLEDDTDE